MTPNNWVLLSSFHQKYKSDMLINALKEKNIPYRIIDKFDSAFNFIGRVEVYVERPNLIKALYIKENLNL